MDSLRLLLIFSSILGPIMGISVPTEQYPYLIGDRCFNTTYERKPLPLGQNYPVGLSMENLISLIERVEAKRPDLNAQAIVILILRRFHIDGLQLTGVANVQSQIEMKHKRITEAIMDSPSMGAVGNVEFPEEALTEDEKCSLFFSLSHTVNEARYNEDSLPKQAAKTAEVIDVEAHEKKKVSRANQQRLRSQASAIGPNKVRRTRMPREKGVVSFRNDMYSAIAANRVLLGAAVGLLAPGAKGTRYLIKALTTLNTENIQKGLIDPLLAVTLSDLLGTDAGSGLIIPSGEIQFGASGQWNSSACQTTYRLHSNGTRATSAELRGGLDGWNIGLKIPKIIKKYPKITLSQILRQYYSPKGLSADASVCNRGWAIQTGKLQNKVQTEAEKYMRVWNAFFYDGSFTDNQLTGFVAENWRSFYSFLTKASEKSSEEQVFCSPIVQSDLKSAPCETSADVFFMLDSMPEGTQVSGASEDQATGFEEEIEIITQVVKSLNLGRNSGSVSVLVNSKGANSSEIFDENGVQIHTPLYALAYNTTSSQCASCRAAWYDNSQIGIRDRPTLLELVNRTLMLHEINKADASGVPSKNFIWFDYGNLNPAPTERGQKRKYDDFKWRLRYAHRDVTFFMATINKEPVKDLLRRDDDWIKVGLGLDFAQYKGRDLINKICQTPQMFQHNECRVKKSEDKVYEGFLTPGYKQYWAMNPVYFIKSYTIEMKFKAVNARIKVCYDRYPTPERNERRCQEAEDVGGEIIWKIKNPCQGKTFESCPAFYFAIALSSQSVTQLTGNNDCTDPRCRSSDQVKWMFKHTGVSCNSTYGL